MEEVLIHLSRIIYKLKEVSQEDKDLLTELILEMKKKSSKFVPPKVEEVSEYLKSKGYLYPHKYAEDFVNFYTSKGWMIGKNKMKNWKAATTQWKEWEKKTKVLV
jgi:SOS response regulatory protein OraA/RecX